VLFIVNTINFLSFISNTDNKYYKTN